MAPWVRLVEAWAVQQLLRTPAFHRAVEGVAKYVHRISNNLPPEQPGGTAIDDGRRSGFGQHFLDELRSQAGSGTKKLPGGVNIDSRAMDHQGANAKNIPRTAQESEEHYDSNKAWEKIQQRAAQPPRQTFGEAYLESLREQMSGGGKADMPTDSTLSSQLSLVSSTIHDPSKMSLEFAAHDVLYENGSKTIHYLLAGPKDGPLLIFLHGWPGIAATWQNQLRTFASLGFCVVAPDMPGMGKSTSTTKVVTDYTQEAISHGLLALLASLDRENGIWIGHDWGSSALATLAATHPHAVRAAAFLAVPYHSMELGLEELLDYINRDIYPIDEYPYGQWDYQVYYERHFEAVNAWNEQDPEGLLKAIYPPGNPAAFLQPAPLSTFNRDGGRFGGAARPPSADATPWEKTILTPDLLSELGDAYKRTGFFGANAWYMNHAANRKYNLEHAVNEGVLEFPVLFIEAKWDTVCATATSKLGEGQRRKCKNLVEVSIEAGHWLQLEKHSEVNVAIEKWLAEEVRDEWPGGPSH